MNEKRSGRSIIIVALLFVIAGLSVGYAVLSQQLTVNGVATVRGATWSVLFKNLSEPNLNGNASVDEDAALEDNSTTMTFAVSLKQPGDSVSYTFDVANEGTIDTEISSVSLIGVGVAADADVTYTLTYGDGSTIAVGDPLIAKQSRQLLLTVTYNASASTVPSGDIVLDLGATINYIQR